ncbi:MAG TPA: diadenylate cyclase CdaA [Candidatus Paceibacterota bacterium]|nr:diadenylate cyclase CdaA [Verrucomicrobiota bacterium]HRY47745.1 diadenylate cyclase CdaA [Candidatus Paceibacterota bacterium]HSA03207.1 diadenylate cyclase CdaA [Candidatus Paceibacterota bacterium]
MIGNILSEGWRPVVEVLILAIGFYYAFIFLRGTRGAAVVTGFLMLLLVLVSISIFLNLRVLTWLLQNFSAIFIVAVLIIFQPELRRILAELGKQPMFATMHQQRANIETIIQAAARLSEMRIGALIAIEQSLNLQQAVESGIVVDCQSTPEMMEAIFFPNNAIHDGGVIIRQDRIAFAACIFPLTRRQDLPTSLGTRHRAAIGLSEETDAVVVVVSEETGAVSYAYQGHLTRGVTEEQLRAFLCSTCIHGGKPQGILDWIWSLGRLLPAKSTSPLKPSERG